MIRRSLLRQSRAFCRRPAPLLKLPCATPQPGPLRLVPIAETSAPRWYSTATETMKDGGAEASPTAEAPASESQPEDKHQTALEAKDREIIDLKVRRPEMLHSWLLTYSFFPSKQHISARGRDVPAKHSLPFLYIPPADTQAD